MGYSLGTLDFQAGRLAVCGFGESPQTQRYCQLEVWGELKWVRPKQFGQGIESACYRVLCGGQMWSRCTTPCTKQDGEVCGG